MSITADFLSLIRRECEQMIAALVKMPRHGIVESYNPANATVRIKFPEDLDYTGQPKRTGWIPWAAGSAGNGWTVMFAPALGMQATVHYSGGISNSAFASGALHSTEQPPPTGGVPEGEFWMQHASGTYIKMTAEGEIESGGGTWNHTGNFAATGSITAGGNSNGQAGCDGSFTTPTGNVVTVRAGVITNIK